jgi:hypothetical protein
LVMPPSISSISLKIKVDNQGNQQSADLLTKT